jgi:hypothetical protein
LINKDQAGHGRIHDFDAALGVGHRGQRLQQADRFGGRQRPGRHLGGDDGIEQGSRGR